MQPSQVIGSTPDAAGPAFARRSLPWRRVESFSILHLGARELYFNPFGSDIWRLLDGRRTGADIAAALSGGAPETTRALLPKVNAFLKQLHTGGIVVAVDAEPEPATADVPAAAARAVSTPEIDECLSRPRAEQGTLQRAIEELYWQRCYIRKMHVELTYRCNYRCPQCYNAHHGGGRGELSVREWDDALRQLAELGCYLLTLTGGELFVRRDVMEILQVVRDHGFTCRLNTNASYLDRRVVEQLARLRAFIQGLDISFYGATPDVYDRITNRPGSYAAAMRAVHLLAEARLPVVAKFITMRENHEGIEPWVATMRELGVRYTVASGMLIPRADREQSPLECAITDRQYEGLITRGWTRGSSHSLGCKPGRVRGGITPTGDVVPCEWLTDIKLGNLRHQSLAAIWYSDTAQGFRALLDGESACGDCALSSTCARCPAHSYLETGNLLSCSPSARRRSALFRAHQARTGATA